VLNQGKLRKLRLAVTVCLLSNVLFAQNPQGGQATRFSSTNPEYSLKWGTNPFDRQLFIENQGQFDSYAPDGEKVIFAAELGEYKMLFTANKVIYYYSEAPKPDADDDKGRGWD